MNLSYCRGLLASAALLTSAQAASPEAAARVAAWLAAWDGQGLHRTATTGDEAGAAWLAREATAIAGPVTSESFQLERIDPVAAYVEIDGERINGEALFDGPSTTAEGLRGLATDATGAGPIAVRSLPPSAVYGEEYRRMRRESPHRALVFLTLGGAPGLAPLNAELFRAPFGPPTVQISSVERDRVLGALARKAEFRVVVHTTRTPAQARNIVLTIAGRDRTRPPLVVMTPRSSWWQSTSERGGGLVCWLETLRALQANPPGCDVVFTANSGHELGHLGLDDFVARRPGWETRATWIHYGANIGAVGSKLQVQSAHDDLRTLAVTHLTTAGQKPDLLSDRGVVPIGETKDIHKAGGRYLTLVGPPNTSPLFHLPQDRWPQAVDVAAVARVAEGMANAVVALTR
ncbi:MAG: hypothetical protein EXS32_16750 [Opitutus sp.]|nr:hypothetical protein [Opitutus sp.]